MELLEINKPRHSSRIFTTVGRGKEGERMNQNYNNELKLRISKDIIGDIFDKHEEPVLTKAQLDKLTKLNENIIDQIIFQNDK